MTHSSVALVTRCFFVMLFALCVGRHSLAEQERIDQLAERLEKHVTTLAEDFHPRSRHHLENQAKCVTYISDHLKKAGGQLSTQKVEYQGETYTNVIARFGSRGGKRFVVGAHYDAPSGSPGADDNASGVAGLIELAYLLGRNADQRSHDVDFELVAYSLEEVGLVGSAAHAESLQSQGVDVVGMISLEMIGYFTDEPDSQDYPLAAMKWIYPNEGNFIAVIGRIDQGEFVTKFDNSMQGYPGVKTLSLAAPLSLRDIRRSDHDSFWQCGWNAVMVTDTAFLRNKEYHRPGDTSDRLDYEKMAHVVLSVRKVLEEMPFRGEGED